MRNFVTNISTEELAHLEMVATIVHQLTKDLSMDIITDLMEDLAAEQKARTTYDIKISGLFSTNHTVLSKFKRGKASVIYQHYCGSIDNSSRITYYIIKQKLLWSYVEENENEYETFRFRIKSNVRALE